MKKNFYTIEVFDRDPDDNQKSSMQTKSDLNAIDDFNQVLRLVASLSRENLMQLISDAEEVIKFLHTQKTGEQ